MFSLYETSKEIIFCFVTPRGALPYVTFTGTCSPTGYGFQGVLSSLSVLNRVSLHDLIP